MPTIAGLMLVSRTVLVSSMNSAETSQSALIMAAVQVPSPLSEGVQVLPPNDCSDQPVSGVTSKSASPPGPTPNRRRAQVAPLYVFSTLLTSMKKSLRRPLSNAPRIRVVASPAHN